ncbi:hypothetical protein [Alkaliphilus serpentinus]|uniref:PASTA domain-containing protein n=1 Tax=Alkaliphilus serpentinus TaxID=1482731 RepID=A0A833HPU0_9FIRM|nr:hypothetical protein [Alkaliphilus serpentinus]KAB3531349.1 hypothetical protein F8153_04000 [Alkaliphilus serpentinus]
MKPIVDILGFKTEEAINALNILGYEVIIKESYGKNTTKSNDSRIIRQRLVSKNEMELIISFF